MSLTVALQYLIMKTIHTHIWPGLQSHRVIKHSISKIGIFEASWKPQIWDGLNNLADQISALATAVHQSYLALLEPCLLCRKTSLMGPFKFELILGAKVSPRVAIRSKWALARSTQTGASRRLLPSTDVAVGGEKRREIGFLPN